MPREIVARSTSTLILLLRLHVFRQQLRDFMELLLNCIPNSKSLLPGHRIIPNKSHRESSLSMGLTLWLLRRPARLRMWLSSGRRLGKAALRLQ
eukprot:12423682-Karenia_brevis.AAC.1